MVDELSRLITYKVQAMVESEDAAELHSKRKAVTALLPYAICRDRDGEPSMFDAFLAAARDWTTLGLWPNDCNSSYNRLFSEATPRAIVLASPHLDLRYLSKDKFVELWDAAVSAVPYTEEFAQSVVDTLLKIVTAISVRSPLAKLPSLLPVSQARRVGSSGSVVKTVRELKNTEILKSYFSLIWSEWGPPQDDGFDEMRASLREDFDGIGMGDHRADLIQRLDYILGRLDQG